MNRINYTAGIKRLVCFVVMLSLIGVIIPKAAAAGSVYLSVYTNTDGSYLFEGDVEVGDNATAFSVLKSSGLEIKQTNGYIKAIAGLEEKQHGRDSGWIYNVNGEHPSAGAAAFRVKDGDRVEWIYAVTAEQGGLVSSNPDSSAAPHVSSENPVEQSSLPADSDLISSTQPSPASLSPESSEEPGQSGAESENNSVQPQVDGENFDSSAVSDMTEETNSKPDTEKMKQAFLKAAKYLKSNPGYWSAAVVKYAGNTPGKKLAEFALSEDGSVTSLERALIVGSSAGLLDADEKSEIADRILSHRDLYSTGTNSLIFAINALREAGNESDLEPLLAALLARRNADGGFPLFTGADSEIDITAMAVAALSERADAAPSLLWLYKNANPDGNFGAPPNCESTAQALIALVSAEDNPSGLTFKTAAALLEFETEDGFSHLIGGGTDVMSTEQAALAIYDYLQLIGENDFPPNRKYTLAIAAAATALVLIAVILTIIKLKGRKASL